jgi:hypothetical protein
VARFAGLDVGPAELRFIEGDRVTLRGSHSAAGNPMRFVTGEIALRRDDEWVRALSPAARRRVTALTAPLLARYGYPIARRPR